MWSAVAQRQNARLAIERAWFESLLCHCFEVWAFSFPSQRPSSISCINEYLAIDGGGNMSENSSCLIAAWLECFPEKSSWCRNEQVCQGGEMQTTLSGPTDWILRYIKHTFLMIQNIRAVFSASHFLPRDLKV